jgi:hypothetical protein
MADTFSIGLSNQGLRSLVVTPHLSVLLTVPVESRTIIALAGGAETDVIATTTMPSNYKVTLDSILVTAANVDNLFKLYRNGTCILNYTPNVALQSVQIFPVGGGKEFDEGETMRLTVTSVVGAGNVEASVSGRAELKKNVLFSPVLA